MLERLTELVAWVGSNYEAVVAGCALFLTGYQTHAARKHNRLSVRPRLVATTHTEVKETPYPALVHELRVTLINAGLGPAIIKDYRVSVDGHFRAIQDHDDLHRLLRERFGEKYLGGPLFVPRPGFVMKAGEERELGLVTFAEKLDDPPGGLEEQLEQLHLWVRYQCAYGTSHRYDTRDHFS